MFDFIDVSNVNNRIFVIGSANGSGNLGDEGMFESIVGYLYQIKPLVRISTDVISMDYKAPNDRVDSYVNFYGTKKSSKLIRLVELLSLKIVPSFGLFLIEKVFKDKSDLYEYKKQLEKSELLIFSGAGAINSVFRGYGIYGWASIAALARAMKIDYYLSGQGIGPFDNWIDKHVALNFISSAKRVKVRDEISEKYLIENGVSNCFSGMDDATYIPKLDTEAAKVLLARIGVEEKKYIVLSLHQWHDSKSKSLDEFTKKITQHYRKKELKVVLLGNKTKGKMNDIPYLKELKVKLDDDNVYIVDFSYSAIDSKTIISNAVSLITTRYHPAIFAYEEQIPTHCIAYDAYYFQKFSGALMYRTDHNKTIHMIDDLTSLVKSIKNHN